MKKNKKNKQASMFSMVENWQMGHQSQYRFCKEQCVSISTFRYWLNKYEKQQEETKKSNQVETSMLHQRFLSLEVSEVGRVDATENFTISYPNGVRLSCSSTTNTQTLRHLINL